MPHWWRLSILCQRGGSTGGQLTAVFLELTHDRCLSGKRVVELGAGTGVVGLCASMLGAAEVTLTDVAAHMELLSLNAKQHREVGRCVSQETLVWGGDIPERIRSNQPDVIIACDVIYAVGEVSMHLHCCTVLGGGGSLLVRSANPTKSRSL